MAVAMPTWDEFMSPIIKLLADGQVRSLRELRDQLAKQVLTAEQLAETLPSGEPKADNRIGWAASYLSRVGAITRPARGQYAITDLGRQLLSTHRDGINERDLRQLAREGDEWWTNSPRTSSAAVPAETPVIALDPVEQVEDGIGRINSEVAADLLTRLHGKDPTFFEHAVVELLVKMGYGGADGQASVTQRSNDGGIDGIIDQDTLGLNRVYIQAKRYAPDTAAGRPELQAFVGALSGKADGGVFITTGRFSQGARDYAENVPTRIILIDGQRLTNLMIRFGVGVQVKETLQIVEIDEDFFE